MKRFAFAGLVLLAVWVALLVTSCRMPQITRAPGTPDATPTTRADSVDVYVIRHGWHAGIAVPRNVIGQSLPDFPEVPFGTRYLEVGWGEAHYFPDPDAGVGAALRAGLWPTDSVVQVAGVSSSLSDAFPQQRIIRLRIGSDDVDALLAFIEATLVRTEDGAAVPVAQGLHRGSWFYQSTLSYHVFQNCNHWAAEALEAAGCRTTRWTSVTVGRLLKQAARCGTSVQ